MVDMVQRINSFWKPQSSVCVSDIFATCIYCPKDFRTIFCSLDLLTSYFRFNSNRLEPTSSGYGHSCQSYLFSRFFRVSGILQIIINLFFFPLYSVLFTMTNYSFKPEDSRFDRHLIKISYRKMIYKVSISL